jgi:SpoVK/Ycf46/Vps4 family AAA+-type ATPase
MSLLHRAKRAAREAMVFFSRSDISKHVTLIKENMDVIEHFIERPTLWRGAKTLVQMGNNFANYLVDSRPSEYFYYGSDSWTMYCGKEIAPLVIDVVKTFAEKDYVVTCASKIQHIRILELKGGVKVGWAEPTGNYELNGKIPDIQELYVSDVNFNQIFSKLLYEKYNGKSLVLLKQDGSFTNDSYTVQLDGLIEALPSAQATQYVDYFTKCFAAGVNRSLLLYGPPGTGKSTMAKQLCKDLKLTSLRIRVEDLVKIDTAHFMTIVTTLNPQCIILDDFDRSDNHEFLFETLTFLRKTVKLVIATANSRSRIDEALMRPGRFDELGYVRALDEKVIKKILGPYVDDVYEDVKDWPISFIDEYVTRRKFQTHEEAKSSMEELAERVDRLKAFDELDENVNISSIITKKNDELREVNK